MSDETERRTWCVEVIPARKACRFTVEAPDLPTAVARAALYARTAILLENARWEVREVQR